MKLIATTTQVCRLKLNKLGRMRKGIKMACLNLLNCTSKPRHYLPHMATSSRAGNQLPHRRKAPTQATSSHTGYKLPHRRPEDRPATRRPTSTPTKGFSSVSSDLLIMIYSPNKAKIITVLY